MINPLTPTVLPKKQTYMKTETCKLYARDFWIFLPKIIKIDLDNSELYRFKVGAFFETQCSSQLFSDPGFQLVSN